MAGVNILAEDTIMISQYSFAWNGWTIFCYIMAMCFVIFTIALIADRDITCILTSVFAIFLFILGTGIANITGEEKVYDHSEYLVTIDETVSFSEFNQKYEVIEQKGELYRIKERVEDDRN